ncbi:hypothetical protein MRX96_014535 [Rhipicephalus microplus]
MLGSWHVTLPSNSGSSMAAVYGDIQRGAHGRILSNADRAACMGPHRTSSHQLRSNGARCTHQCAAAAYCVLVALEMDPPVRPSLTEELVGHVEGHRSRHHKYAHQGHQHPRRHLRFVGIGVVGLRRLVIARRSMRQTCTRARERLSGHGARR